MPVFYFRNDDVNVLDDELIAVTRRCTEEGIPITHAVEPANVRPGAVEWLLAERGGSPRLIEIMQHGWDHVKRERGEFGGHRPLDEQHRDLSRGRAVLTERFGEAFLPCLNFPFGPYNQHTMRAADQIGYRVVCSHYNCRPSRRIMYAVGHVLRRGNILDRHVSWHLDFYPGTGLFCVDMAVSLIRSYEGEYGSRSCHFHALDTLCARIDTFTKHTPVVGILLHHRFHTARMSLDLITDLIRYLKTIPGAEFLNIGEIYRRWCPQPGEGFRHGT